MADLLTTRPLVLMRRMLPGALKPVLGGIWRAGRDRLHYVRGKRMLRRYTAHHGAARRFYASECGGAQLPVNRIAKLGVVVIRRGESNDLLSLPTAFYDAVTRVAAATHERLDEPANTRLVRSDDKLLAAQLINPLGVLAIDELEALAAPIVSGLQQTLFGSYAIVDRIYVYRTLVTGKSARPRASWLWHYDNHPSEVIKVMIYLTDVDDDTAPFEFLRRPDSLVPAMGSPITPMYRDSRLGTEYLTRVAAQRYEPHMVTGAAGTTILFDSNVVHRARFARMRQRDVLTLQIRPVTFRPARVINASWTGSFQHYDVNERPDDLSLRAKTG